VIVLIVAAVVFVFLTSLCVYLTVTKKDHGGLVGWLGFLALLSLIWLMHSGSRVLP
jgi:hypothetical protein